MATYFVDFTGGSDSNDGLSSGAAWKTISKVNGSSFSAGDTIQFKKGEVWRETLIPPSSGSAGNPIVFGSYGTGAKPIIKGTDLLTSWTLEVVGAFNAYKKVTTATANKQIFEDGVRLQQVASAAALVVGSFFWDAAGGQVYVRLTGDDSPAGHTMEWSIRTYCIDASAVTDITIQDLDTAQGRAYCILGGNDNLTVQRCTVRDAFVNNIEMAHITVTFTSPAVYDCDVYGAGGTGVSIGYKFTGLRIQRNNIHENSQLRDTLTGGNANQGFSGGIKLFCNQVNDDGADTLISDNLVWGNGPAAWVTPDGVENQRGVGIWFDMVRVPSYATLGAALVRYNRVYDNAGIGIFMEKTAGAGVEYNIVYNNALYQGTAGLMLQANSATSAPGPSWAYNNTVYGTGWAAVLMGNDNPTPTFTNHSLKNNIMWNTTNGRHLYFQGEGADVGDGNFIDYNLYAPHASFKISALDATLGVTYTTLASWQAASGQDAHSITADPLLTDVGTGDFTIPTGSPAKDAGLDVGLTRDFAAHSIAGAPDIGAYEYNVAGDLKVMVKL